MKRLTLVLILAVVAVAFTWPAATTVKCGQYNVCTFTATGGTASWEFSDWKQWGGVPVAQNPYTRPMSTHSPVDGSTPYTTTVVNLATNDTSYVQCHGRWSPRGSMCKEVRKP